MLSLLRISVLIQVVMYKLAATVSCHLFYPINNVHVNISLISFTFCPVDCVGCIWEIDELQSFMPYKSMTFFNNNRLIFFPDLKNPLVFVNEIFHNREERLACGALTQFKGGWR